MSAPVVFLKEIRIEHTLFALPFAYVGAVLAARGMPSWHALLWITVAVLGARTAAMAANRYFDRDLDRRNPRTARRAVASGRLAPGVMIWAMGAGLAALILSAWMLSPLCVRLLPLAVLGVLLYPLCKRWWWGTHFVLGAVDAMAPLGAYIAVANNVSLSAVLLFVAVLVWVAGFDIIYALMDLQVDREQGLASVPSRFGEALARRFPAALHAIMIVALAVAGYLAGASWWYFVGVGGAAMLLAFEQRQFRRAQNLFALNERIFVSNMAFSVAFLGTTVAGFAFR